MKEANCLDGKCAVFVTLGCKLNFAETSALCDRLQAQGVRRARPGEAADICIVNTCTVTETSNHKSRQAIHRVVRENPGALVVVMGCYAQACAEQVAAIGGVGLVVGMEQKGNVVELLRRHFPQHAARQGEGATPSGHIYSTDRKSIASFVPSCSRGTRTRYFIKIQDGCDYFCTYCAIPMARGRSRNGSIATVVEQARKAAQEGAREIVITGVNIGDFGKSTGERLLDLLAELDQIAGVARYRISSIEPNLLTPEILEFCAKSRAFMPHFHIPLQSGSDAVLQLMHRRYDTRFFAEKIQSVRQFLPHAFIGVDVIVGMRGETPELFEQTHAFVRGLDISQLHVFTYSERPNTAALRIP